MNSEGDKVDNKNIIKFSHMLHAEQMDCADCHTNVPQSTKLSDRLLPEKEICAECHDVEDEDNCDLCHYDSALFGLRGFIGNEGGVKAR